MYLGKPHTHSNIAWHRPMSAEALQEEELMQQSDRTLQHTTDPMDKLRLLCLSRGATGIMVLGRTFRRMYENGCKQLNKEEFVNSLKQTGLDLKEKDVMDLFKKFDTNHTGYISLDNFIREIRPPMSESRRAIVVQVFKKLDQTGAGVISFDDIRRVYAVTSHPRYMSGEETAGKVMNEFLTNFEAEGVHDGTITLDDFMNYYSGISVSIDDDCYFDLMMRQAWHL